LSADLPPDADTAAAFGGFSPHRCGLNAGRLSLLRRVDIRIYAGELVFAHPRRQIGNVALGQSGLLVLCRYRGGGALLTGRGRGRSRRLAGSIVMLVVISISMSVATNSMWVSVRDSNTLERIGKVWRRSMIPATACRGSGALRVWSSAIHFIFLDDDDKRDVSRG